MPAKPKMKAATDTSKVAHTMRENARKRAASLTSDEIVDAMRAVGKGTFGYSAVEREAYVFNFIARYRTLELAVLLHAEEQVESFRQKFPTTASATMFIKPVDPPPLGQRVPRQLTIAEGVESMAGESLADKELQSACKVCNDRIFWQSCPTGGWWIHTHHPADDHDAQGPEVHDSVEDED
jgi:hypothetical protein